MKYLLCLISLAFVLSCNSNTKDNAKQEEKSEMKVYDMYEPSEMAILMNEFYAINEKIKADILAGNTPEEFPLDFMKIHRAELSDFKKRNAKFEAFSKLYIEAEKEVFNTESSFPVEERFNNAIGVCISCHQTECTGPIPRIKKLLIK
ncbi:hypothetical protein [Lacinutrix sp. Bg11-31]|uniref:hypothetical protein n=1 Tax=Lacinutrix sp. Bg11-31 TaxID=2057808 RepID=UPI000C30958D|nr:hypothetical protein [Lacinutrix sp. Bg11-31]AUC80675.1 hypothetical protein CW733_00385 [Lacinutrix sp. Bg11-31]